MVGKSIKVTSNKVIVAGDTTPYPRHRVEHQASSQVPARRNQGATGSAPRRRQPPSQANARSFAQLFEEMSTPTALSPLSSNDEATWFAKEPQQNSEMTQPTSEKPAQNSTKTGELSTTGESSKMADPTPVRQGGSRSTAEATSTRVAPSGKMAKPKRTEHVGTAKTVETSSERGAPSETANPRPQASSSRGASSEGPPEQNQPGSSRQAEQPPVGEVEDDPHTQSQVEDDIYSTMVAWKTSACQKLAANDRIVAVLRREAEELRAEQNRIAIRINGIEAGIVEKLHDSDQWRNRLARMTDLFKKE